MLNRKRIFAIVLFVLIGLFVYTFANPAEDLEPLDNKNNTEDVDKNKDDDKKDKEDVIQLPDEEDNNPVPVIVNAVNYGVLRTAVDNGTDAIELETENEALKGLLDQLKDATNQGQGLITAGTNNQNLVNTRAETINQLLVQFRTLLTSNLKDAIDAGSEVLDYYFEKNNLNSNLLDLLDDLFDEIEAIEDIENPTNEQMLDALTKILEILIDIDGFQRDLTIINNMSLKLVPSTTDWTYEDIILTPEIDIENFDLIKDINIVSGTTCTVEEPLPMFSRISESIVMAAINDKKESVSANGNYTACVTFKNGELRHEIYEVKNIDKDKPTLKLDAENSTTYRPEHRRKATVSDLGGSSIVTSVYAWVREEDIATFDIKDLSAENGFKPLSNNQNIFTPVGENGSYRLIMVAIDGATNKTEYISDAIFNIDNTGPTVTIDAKDIDISKASKSFDIKVKVEDEETSIKYVKYQWTRENTKPSFDTFNDKTEISIIEGKFSNLIPMPEDKNGNWYLWVLAVNGSEMYSDSDLATYNYQCKSNSIDGKCTVYTIEGMGAFVLDNVTPIVSSLTQQYEEGKIKVTVQYSEPVTGFLVGDNEWNNLGGNLYSKYYTGTQDVTIDFEDLAGNPNSYTFAVDNTAPVATVRYTEITKENGESYDLLTGVSSDDSTVVPVAKFNGNVVTNSNELPIGTHTINYTFTDAVGNYATATATITIKVDYTVELLPRGIVSPRRIAFTYWFGQYTINSVSLITPEGVEIPLSEVEIISDFIYGRQRVVLTKDQYNQLDSETYSIKVTYKNNWLNLDNLVMYYTF